VSNALLPCPLRAVVAIVLASAALAMASAVAMAASGPGDAGTGPASLVTDAGCAPDPDTGETSCGERDAAVPEAAMLGVEPPLATTLAGVRVGSPTAIEQATSTFGLSDQNDPSVVNAWRDARATGRRGLHLHEGRLVVPWNVYSRAKAANPEAPASPATRVGRDLDRWRRVLLEMKKGGFDTPIVSFERQRDIRTSGRIARQPLPTPSEYLSAVSGFVDYIDRLDASGPGDRYPRLLRFTAWNEPNNRTQPTADDPRRAGQYFRALAAWCAARCSVAAGDFAEQSATAADAAEFTRYLQAYCDGMDGKADDRCGYRARLWAFHPYSCGFRHDTTGVRDFVRLTAASPDGAPSPQDAKIWFTEAGGVVTQHYNVDPDGHAVSRRTLVARADRDLAFLLDECVAVSPRITRFYVYHWAGDRRLDPSSGRDRGFEADLTDIARPISGSPLSRYGLSPLYCTLKAAVNPGPCHAGA
jgi:hypothetical protein